MNVSRSAALAIVTGRKTQLRRPLTAGKRCALRIGHDYGVRVAGRRELCRIDVLGVHRGRLRDVGFREARAEGFRTADDFRCWWVREHDHAWFERHKLGLLDEPLIAAAFDGDVSVINWILLKRFTERHAQTAVWVISFAVQHDPSLFMASQHDILGGAEQYTATAARAIDQAEVVPAGWLDDLARLARLEGEQLRDERRRAFLEERQRLRNHRALLRRVA